MAYSVKNFHQRKQCDQSFCFVAPGRVRSQHAISVVILDYTFKCTAVAWVTEHYKILNNHTVTSHQTHSNKGSEAMWLCKKVSTLRGVATLE